MEGSLQSSCKEGKKIGSPSSKRTRRAAHAFLNKAIQTKREPRVTAIDNCGLNKPTIRIYNRRNYSKIKIRLGQLKQKKSISKLKWTFFSDKNY